MHLDFYESMIHVCGSEEEGRLLLSIPGAVRSGSGVSIPPDRLGVLATEVCGKVTEATDAYRDARDRLLGFDEARVQRAMEAIRQTGADPDQLLTHQRAAIVQFYDQRAAYLAADMGVGKSRIALLLARLWGGLRVLVVCQKGIVSQWEEQQRLLWPKERDRAIVEQLDRGTLEERAKALRDCGPVDWRQRRVLFGVNYDVIAPRFVARSQKVFSPGLCSDLAAWEPDVLILDEPWILKSPTAAVTKALTCLTKDWRERGVLKGVIGLAGTPWGNHAGDIWSQLRIIAPEVVPETYFEFLQSFATFEQRRVRRGNQVIKPVGLRDPVGLIRKLEPIWFRASKEACLDLPPKRTHRVELVLPRDTQKLYREVKKDGLAALGDELALDGAREVAIRLQQIAGGHVPVPHGEGWHLNPLANCPKIEWLREFASSVLVADPSARCLVWCQFIAEIERVTEVLREVLGGTRAVSCYGRTAEVALRLAKADYQSRRPELTQVLVCQYQKMAAAHDLYATSHAIYFSPTWSYLLRSQSEDRGHRIGNDTGVQLVDLVAKGTIDETVLACLARKRDFVAQMMIDTTVAARK